uniref:Transthyretin-like family protein n=1 Tax=Acrobeloides nanus TaxID=290746 RepID=A0A914D6H8_9BILA
MILLLFVVLALTSFKFSDALLGIGSFQTINVHGSLTCDGKPAKDVLVKLYDVNKIIPDNLLGEIKSNSSGKFAIKGEINDITKMDPKVNIYTDCHVGVLRCTKKVEINVPHRAINTGESFDIGSIELATTYPGESHDCIH